MKAREWLERGFEKTDPIDLLTDFWRAFNNLYYKFPGGPETEKIKLFLNQAVDNETAKELIKSNQEEIAYLLSEPIIDMRGNGKDTKELIDNFHKESNLLEKLKNIFLIIYQVRCNLEHGQKSPSRDRDVQLCESSWPFVAEIVDRNS